MTGRGDGASASAPVAPTIGSRKRVLDVLATLRERHRDLDGGHLADSIPALATVDPDCFAIAVATVDGEVFGVGDARVPFTLQSISKPFAYGRALEARGRAGVLERVGVEPSGDVFNSIIRLDSANRPHNPCVNAGAIATTGMLVDSDPSAGLDRMLEMLSTYAGRRLGVDMSVFVSERSTGHRNRAIAHLLCHFEVVEEPVDRVLDLYFQQCSVLVDCRDLALMGATLANGGLNPVTGARALDRRYLRDVLTVMYTCGMYDYAGQWAYTVGLPAKSGICGGIVVVVPGKFGIACYSPRVDERGHSVRGIRVCEDLSHEFGIHLFDTLLGPVGADVPTAMFDQRRADASAAADDSGTLADRVIGHPAPGPDRGRAPSHEDEDEDEHEARHERHDGQPSAREAEAEADDESGG